MVSFFGFMGLNSPRYDFILVIIFYAIYLIDKVVLHLQNLNYKLQIQSNRNLFSLVSIALFHIMHIW